MYLISLEMNFFFSYFDCSYIKALKENAMKRNCCSFLKLEGFIISSRHWDRVYNILFLLINILNLFVLFQQEISILKSNCAIYVWH